MTTQHISFYEKYNSNLGAWPSAYIEVLHVKIGAKLIMVSGTHILHLTLVSIVTGAWVLFSIYSQKVVDWSCKIILCLRCKLPCTYVFGECNS